LNSVEDLAAEQFEQNKLAVEKRPPPTKRGRKKKNEAVEAAVITEDFESNVDVSFEAANPGEGQKKAKKRGRKKKEVVPIVEEAADVAIDDQGLLEQSQISKSENIFDTSSLEKIIEKQPQQKRGRKKKKSVLISEDDPINGLEEPQNDSVAIQNDIIQVSSEKKVKSKRTKKSKSKLIDVEIAATIEPAADLEPTEIIPSIVENKKASKKRAKKRKNSSIEEDESPAAPEEVEEGGPSPRKRGRPSTTIPAAPAPKKTENKKVIRKKTKTPRRKTIPEAPPPMTFNQDKEEVDEDDVAQQSNEVITQPRKNTPASLRTNMRSTDASKRTTRTQESKRNWEHVLNTNPETMFRKQK
jgi:hypothetical protein